jgi:hypothetical protein
LKGFRALELTTRLKHLPGYPEMERVIVRHRKDSARKHERACGIESSFRNDPCCYRLG